MRHACLIYFDPQKVFDRSPEAEAVLRDSMPYDAELEASGQMVTSLALTLPGEGARGGPGPLDQGGGFAQRHRTQP